MNLSVESLENLQVGPEKLQTMMRQEGVQPEDNLLSRGVIAMREE